MVRRSPKAAKRFKESIEPVAISSAEKAGLHRADKGYHVIAKMRQTLTSKGLIFKTPSGQLMLTKRGEVSLARYGSKKAIQERQTAYEPALSPRDRWLAKHAPPFSRAAD